MTQPVRVPNVSPGARSGLDHEVIGANAQEAYDENKRLSQESGSGETPETPDGDLPEVPEDLTSEADLLGWVTEVEDDETAEARARAVLAAEKAKPEDEQRVTLVEPLEASLSDDGGDAGTETPGDGSEAGSAEQEGQGDPSETGSTPTSGIDTESAGQEAQTQGDPTP